MRQYNYIKSWDDLFKAEKDIFKNWIKRLSHEGHYNLF